MRVFRFIGAMVTALLLAAPLTAGAQISCGRYLDEAEDFDWKHATNITFVLGFIRGAQWEGGRPPQLGLDNQALQKWLENYCEARPLDSLVDASGALTQELRRRAFDEDDFEIVEPPE